jgi:hypothetical protein
MSRKMIELTVDVSTDVFKVQELLQRCSGVKPHITTIDSMRIYYQTDKIEEKEIFSIISACAKKKGSNNILSITRKNLSNE